MKFKFINTISVMQKKFLVFLTCSEGRIKHARGSDSARGLCIPAVYNLYYILLVKDLPKVPVVTARMGLEPTTFRSKGIASTNVSTRPTNINRYWKKKYY